MMPFTVKQMSYLENVAWIIRNTLASQILIGPKLQTSRLRSIDYGRYLRLRAEG